MSEEETNAGSITVRQFYEFGAKRLKMKLEAGADGLSRPITNARVQKTGLALANFVECTTRDRVQLMGRTEMTYLETLEPEQRMQTLDNLFGCEPACFVVTAGISVPDYLREVADRHRMPLFSSPQESIDAIDLITHFLDLQLAPRMSIHGNLLDIFGLGVLLIGESGVGKSECALELIARGHRLVADDNVEIKLVENEVLLGSCPEEIRYLMELRGIGLIDVKDLFGIGSVRDSKKIEVVIGLEHWQDEIEYPRLGVDDQHQSFFGINIPYVIMPVAPGRNLAILVEVAARNQLLKIKGVNVAKRVTRRLDRKLRRSGKAKDLKTAIGDGAGLFE
ncbi:MAG TPA: HPr(Ser) kinase/phosphatase [Acidobacteriota bacterium]|nr:HPr(Ser) kinase/phosphatase [Acidobacteriota bacterium]